MQKIYAAYHKNPEEIEKSSSGAMFAALSDAILEQGGKIIGARYNYVSHKLEHMVCQTPEERDLCRGSKYIQSHITGGTYKILERELVNGTPILYVGTPCQIAAFKQYLVVKNIHTNGIYTCDILCHGVGSPGVWNKFIQWKNARIDFLTFKDKRNGWKKPICVAKEGRKEISLRGYSWLYFSDAIMRPICYECGYAKTEREGDFTIGDFWKAESKVPDMYNPRGTSFIMVNTENGQRLFETVKQNLVYREVALDDVLQNNMQYPTRESVYRKEVMTDYNKMPAGTFFRKWEIKLLMSKLKKKIAHW